MCASWIAAIAVYQDCLASLLPNIPQDVFYRKHSQDGRNLLRRQLSSGTKLRVLTDACSRCCRICRISSRLYALKLKVKAPPKCQLQWTICSFCWTLIPASPKLQQRPWNISPSLFSYPWTIWLWHVGTLISLIWIQVLSPTPALRTAPMHISTLFPDSIIKRAEEEIAHYENKGHTSGSRGKGQYYPFKGQKRLDRKSSHKPDRPAWKNIGRGHYKKGRGKSYNYSSRPAKGQQSYKWQLLCRQVTGRTAGWEPDFNTKTMNTYVNSHVVKLAHTAPRQ